MGVGGLQDMPEKATVCAASLEPGEKYADGELHGLNWVSSAFLVT